MMIADEMWRQGLAAQRTTRHMAAYSTAFWGAAMTQAVKLGLNAPVAFWSAMGRAGQGGEAAEPTPMAPVAETAPREAAPDDLTALLGVGRKLAASLNAAGITRYAQIAALDEAGIAALEAKARGFRMIAARYDLVAQARTRG